MENNTNVENPVVVENNAATVVENPTVTENNTVENVFAASEPVVNNNENNINNVIVPELNKTEVVENNSTSEIVPELNKTEVVENNTASKIVPNLNNTEVVENNTTSEIVPELNKSEVVENNNTNTSSEVSHNIKIVDIDGVEKEVELLCYFTLNSNNKKYVAYTDNNEDENGNVIISTAEVVEKEDNTIEFVSISEPAVLEEVKKVLLDLAK